MLDDIIARLSSSDKVILVHGNADPDALGTPGTSCFYLVVPIGGGSTAYPPSNRVGVVNFALTAGGP